MKKLNLFKKAINSLFKMNYIVTIESGNYVVREKESQKEHLSFAVNDKDKDRALVQFYANLLENLGRTEGTN